VIHELPSRIDDGPRAVEARGLRKAFGDTTALDGTDVTVPEGAVYLLVGPNGAGKTTFLRHLLGLMRSDAGELRVLGLDPGRDESRVRASLGYVPERRGLGDGPGQMKVRHLLDHHGSYHPAWDRAYARRLCDALEVVADREFGDLSKGQARRVQLVQALAHRPPLLLLDEPADGLDPVVRERLLGLLAEHLHDHPATVLYCTHHPREAETLVDHVGVICDGRMAYEGRLDDLQRRLRRYRLRPPPDWNGRRPDVPVLQERRSATETAWVAWGEEKEVRRAMEAAGADVRETSGLSLEEAVLALMKAGGGSGVDVPGRQGRDR
jgi:ABC-2 type transport system ATP-binding protein